MPKEEETEFDRLEVTKINTINGVSITEFIALVNNELNRYTCMNSAGDLTFNVCYYATVDKISDNNYHIWYNWTDYILNTTGYPFLAKKMDKFCNITKRREFERESFSKVEKNESLTNDNRRACIRYLKKIKREYEKIINKFKVTLGFSIGGLLLLPLGWLSHLYVLPFLGLATAAVSFVLLVMIITEDYSISDCFRKNKDLARDISFLEKSLDSGESKTKTNTKTDSENPFEDAINNYMRSIIKASKRLDGTEKDEILAKLDKISVQYAEKREELVGKENRGLTLETPEGLRLIKDTLNELSALELEIAILVSRSKHNSTALYESNKLLGELNTTLNDMNGSEGLLMTSTGTVKR